MDTIISVLSSLGTVDLNSFSAYQQVTEALSYYKYLLLIPLTVLQGPIIMMLSGILIRLDILSFWPAYFALMAGDLIGDTLWYGVGYYLGPPFLRKFGRIFSITQKHVHNLE